MNPLLLKRAIARFSKVPFVGATVGWLFQDQVPSRGLIIDTRGLAAETKSQLLFRTYESAEIRAVQRYLRRDLDVIELGAGIGVLSCHIRRKLDPLRCLYCVEANPKAVETTVRNLNRNGLNSNVTVIHAALSYASGPVSFTPGNTHLSGQVGNSRAGIVIPALTLSDLLSRFGLSEFAMVCDVEGSEGAMIALDPAALSRCRQMVIELHSADLDGTHYDADDLAELLQADHGFSLTSRYGNVCAFERD